MTEVNLGKEVSNQLWNQLEDQEADYEMLRIDKVLANRSFEDTFQITSPWWK